MIHGSKLPRVEVCAATQHARIAAKVLFVCLVAAAAMPIVAAAQPYSGTPISIPGTIQAERFDRGGEGPGYHELTAANTSGAFRPSEGVDIRNDPASMNNNWIVTGFETGEWLAYTINVTTAGQYDWGVRASSPYTGSAYYLQLDGKNVTGAVTVPNTGGWDNFKWVPAPSVYLSAGKHMLKVVSYKQYFDLDLVVIFASAAAPVQTVQSGTVNFSCAFNSLPACNFIEQAKVAGRATLTSVSRDGGKALRLHTEPGDNNVAGSGSMERDDVYLATPGTANPETYGEGVEQWWAHSMLFPDDFVVPTTQAYTVFDFHNTGSAWQANFHVTFAVQDDNDLSKPGVLSFIGYGGTNPMSYDGRYGATIGVIQKNVWYDFVYHVRWSSGSDGIFDAWLNGKKMLTHRGPTLFAGQKTYLKLANYHMTVCGYQGCGGSKASSVIHDRIVRGTSAQAVAIGALEGVP